MAFTIIEAAKRDSINRKKGTLITKPLNVNNNIYYDYFTTKIIPVIKARFPRGHDPNITIGIQHDNALSHFGINDPRWVDFINNHNNNNNGLKFSLKEQPPNSPDTNTLDLSFFASVQSMKWGMSPAKNVDTLTDNVELAYQQYDPHALDRAWISHQSCLNEILACNGNHYKLPHLGKDKMVNESAVLPRSIHVTDKAEQTLETLKIFDVADFI
jgi:hypothetical protein